MAAIAKSRQSAREDEYEEEAPPPRAPKGPMYAYVAHDAEAYRHGGIFNLADHNFHVGAGLFLKGLEKNPADAETDRGFIRAAAHVRRDREYYDEGLRWWDEEALGVEDPLAAELRRRRENPNWHEDLEREDAMRAMRGRSMREQEDEEPPEELEMPEVVPDDEDLNAIWPRMYLQDLILKEPPDRRAEVLAAIRDLTAQHFTSLVKVFRYYSRLMTGGIPRLDARLRAAGHDTMFTMSKREFEKLVHDCRISENATMGASINVAFVMANRQYDENGLPKQEEEAGNRADQLLLYEFIQCLVRVAHIKYGGIPSLPERYYSLLSRDVLPNAKMDSFEILRAELATAEAQEVVARHLPKLREVYRTYAQKQPELPSMKHRLKTIQMREWFALFQELGIIDHKLVTNRIVQTSFVQANLVDEATYEDMDLTEFVEGLARVAVERVPVRGDRSEAEAPPLAAVLDDFCRLLLERYYQVYRPPVRQHRPASGAGFRSASRRLHRRSRSPKGGGAPRTGPVQLGAGYKTETAVTELMGVAAAKQPAAGATGFGGIMEATALSAPEALLTSSTGGASRAGAGSRPASGAPSRPLSPAGPPARTPSPAALASAAEVTLGRDLAPR